MATAPGKPFWSHSGSGPTFANPNVGDFSVGEAGWGAETDLAPHNNDRASRVSGREPVKTAFARGRMPQGEAVSARLSISPSGKIPSNAESSGSLGSSTKVVKSKGRAGSFAAGQNVGY